ncbi:hypothetical protein [Allomesorhizobium camelthorni]|uniref:hypothetical protein n=1 Tax=Allomesorhizobium camelthorni TaxID=475069 RepID=UPI00197E460E|nr:hypothetical protein [Mesorhizobium camelthorni]
MSFLMAIAVAVIAAIVGLAIVSAILRWLWNATMPEVFGLRALTFWQAVKLLLIATILFGGPTSAVHLAPDDGGPVIAGLEDATGPAD